MNDLIDSRQMRSFLVLAREGSFSAAGRSLNLTQSAISHAIKSLEQDLGCQLFLRQGREVHLTPHGRELRRHAERIEEEMRLARSLLGSLDQSPKGRIRIGCTAAASQFILPTVFREFKDSFPLYDIQVTPGETPQIVEHLLAGRIDLSVSLRPEDVSRMDCHSIFDDRLQFLVSPLHPWAKAKPKLGDAVDQTFIVSSSESLSFAMLNDFFLKQGVRLHSFIELGSTEAMKELAKLGLGVAVVAPWTAKAELESGQLVDVPIPKAKLVRRWVAATLKGRPRTLAERTFLGLCEELGRNFAS